MAMGGINPNYMNYMNNNSKPVPGRRAELVCVLCSDTLADMESCVNEELLAAVSDTNTADEKGERGGGQCEGNVVSHGADFHNRRPREKSEVVATKCGHLFHRHCLRQHVTHTLDGRGGGVFCPICSKPVALNRVQLVNIPATKAQRERFEQFYLMKAQNKEMHQQIRDVRAKIQDAEVELKKIKEQSEECLKDIKAKEKLLDSINGPTNKEMAELTKEHMKRQEVLRVVTQHNADLLKLLAEESNLKSQKGGDPNRPDSNQNYLPQIHPSIKMEFRPSMINDEHEETLTTRDGSRGGVPPRKSKKKKSGKRSRRRKGSKTYRKGDESSAGQPQQYTDFNDNGAVSMTPLFGSPPPPPSQLLSMLEGNDNGGGDGSIASCEESVVQVKHAQHQRKQQQHFPRNRQVNIVETTAKWEMESNMEPINEKSSQSFSRINTPAAAPRIVQLRNQKNDKNPPPKNNQHEEMKSCLRRDKNAPKDRHSGRHNNNRGAAQGVKDPIDILLARKPPMDKGGRRVE